jgi:multidrug efflux pump subunit AcrB
MFERFLRFFIDNARINYLLFILVFILGIYSYIKTPKEIFPSFELDMISISGHYNGASIDILDKMAVKDIEDEVKNIDGIKEMATIISPTRFNMILELEKRVDRYNTANKVKDALSVAKQNLPDDMDEPIVSVLEIKRDLLDISIVCDPNSDLDLVKRANYLKDKISNLKNISEVIIRGDSEIYYDITLNMKKIKALKLNENLLFNEIASLSYIYPIGKIEDSKGGHFYISTFNGKKRVQELLNTRIKVSGKTILLKDIATIKKRYEDTKTLFIVDNKSAIDLAIKQSRIGNALLLSKEIKRIVKELNQKNDGFTYIIHNDHSVRIKDRLNIIVSNILLGLILISLLVMFLINSRMSLIITLGIPTSFVIGAFYLYISGYTINMISLVGVLIALGIIVDDAIVVSENIQQHLEKGLEPKEAAMRGAQEMFKPVTIASLTTLFAFIPALMMSGTMGEVIKLIPIAVSVLVLASLIESFVFLPIHAAHILKKDQKARSWEKANKIYSKIIHYLIKYKKSFLFSFIILVPFLMILGVKMSKFQMFPKFDASTISLTLKANVNTTTQETNEILKSIQRDIYKNRDKFFIDHIGSVAGWRRDSAGNSETYPYVGIIKIELQKLKPQNFVDRYITPNLSFYYDKHNRLRDEKSKIVAKKLRAFLKKMNYKDKFNLTDIDIVEKKVGPIKSDLKIGLIGEDSQKIAIYIKELKTQLSKLEGITSVNSGIKFGIDEIKLKINSYGESLGLTERSLGKLLSNIYLERKVALSYDSEDLLEIKIKSSNKDSIEELKNYKLNIGSNRYVMLKDVVEFKVIKSFEKVIKDFGEKNFYIYANVDPKLLTANEALTKIKPILDTIKSDGIKLKFKGEKEKQKDLKNDMIAASSLAMVLIMLSMLYLFNSFRETLMMMSVIPFAFLGVLIGHFMLGLNLSMPSIIGMLGLSGVVINDGIIMMMNLKKAENIDDIYHYASKRFRPIVLTSITTLIGLSSLIFFPTGQATIFQPMAIALGFGLAWGTILNLLYLPVLYTFLNAKRIKNL